MKGFLDTVKQVSGVKRRLVNIPFPMVLFLSYPLAWFSKISGAGPPFTPAEVKRFRMDWLITSGKAERELGYKPRSFSEGIKTTIAWLNSRNIH